MSWVDFPPRHLPSLLLLPPPGLQPWYPISTPSRAGVLEDGIENEADVRHLDHVLFRVKGVEPSLKK
jgi:hypothetical protein